MPAMHVHTLVTLGLLATAMAVARGQLEVSCGKPFELLMVIDGSGSIDVADFGRFRTFLKDLIRSFSVGSGRTRIGMVQFSTNIHEEHALSGRQTEEALLASVDAMVQENDATNTPGGVQKANDQYETMARPPQVATRIQIIMTDGAYNSQYAPFVDPAVQRSRGLGVETYAIAVGNIDMDKIHEFTTSEQHVFTTQTFSSIHEVLQPLVLDACCNCTENGVCNIGLGSCVCNPGWAGDACEEELICPGDCSGLGQCVLGICECDPGRSGPSCENNWLSSVGLALAALAAIGLVAASGIIFIRQGYGKAMLNALGPPDLTTQATTNLTSGAKAPNIQDKPLMWPASRTQPTAVKSYNPAFTVI